MTDTDLEEQEYIIKNVLQFLISKSDYLTEKRMQKLFYIAEIEYIQKYGKRFSDVTFISHKHGMYSFDIKYLLDTLEDEGKITSVFKKTKDGYDAQFFHPNKRKIIIELNDKRIEILNAIIKNFIFRSTEEIIKFAKSTKPYKTTPLGKKIDLERYAEECFDDSLLRDKKITSDIIESEREYKKGVFTKFDSHSKLLKHLDSV